MLLAERRDLREGCSDEARRQRACSEQDRVDELVVARHLRLQ